MAMLAEPKTKQKWSNDPRNTAWTNDTSRFGYQMLTKMGWESGKGLGAKEDGSTTHVKTAKRRDNLGLGADKSNEDNWLSHQLAFDDLLSHLNDHAKNDDEGEKRTKKRKKHEMEKTARQSRKRVFYNRFIQSKDLSSKSAEDMACIFGQRSKSAPGTPQDMSEDEDSDDSTASCPPPSSHGVQTITSGQSVQEYFEMKMREMKAAREGKELQREKTAQQEIVEDEVRENGSELIGDAESESKKTKKEKRRKRKSVKSEGELENDETGSHCVDDQSSAKKKKRSVEAEEVESDEKTECKVSQETKGEKEKKKKRKEKKVIDLENCEVNETNSEKVENLDTEEATKGGKKKDKKKRKEDKKASSVDMEMEERTKQKDELKKATNSIEVEEIKKKEKKRNKKDKDVFSSNEDASEMSETKGKEKKKKKKKKKDKSDKIDEK